MMSILNAHLTVYIDRHKLHLYSFIKGIDKLYINNRSNREDTIISNYKINIIYII